MLVVDRRGRAREVVDLVDLDIKWEGDIVSNYFEVSVIEQVLDIATRAGEKIVDAENVAARQEKLLAKVGAEEPRPSRHQKPSL